jgi:two-component sensor histidine kinase
MLNLTCTEDGDDLVLLWTERGGPAVKPPSHQDGFGSALVKRSVSGQLGGSIAFDWCPEGVIITLRMARRRLAA